MQLGVRVDVVGLQHQWQRRGVRCIARWQAPSLSTLPSTRVCCWSCHCGVLTMLSLCLSLPCRNAYNMVLHKHGDRLYNGLITCLTRHLTEVPGWGWWCVCGWGDVAGTMDGV
jgi:hypothetical protein